MEDRGRWSEGTGGGPGLAQQDWGGHNGGAGGGPASGRRSYTYLDLSYAWAQNREAQDQYVNVVRVGHPVMRSGKSSVSNEVGYKPLDRSNLQGRVTRLRLE